MKHTSWLDVRIGCDVVLWHQERKDKSVHSCWRTGNHSYLTISQCIVPEFVNLLLHMTYIVLTYKIVVDLLFKVNCHINMFIMSINSVL